MKKTGTVRVKEDDGPDSTRIRSTLKMIRNKELLTVYRKKVIWTERR